MNFVEKFDGFLPKLDAHSRGSVHVDNVSANAPPGAIVVEDGKFLFTADFKRAGLDLVLSKDDRELVLHDYFKGEKRAALASPDGAHLTGELVNALTGYTQYAQAGGAPDSAKVIGHVTKLIGNANAIRNGVAIVLNQGDNVNKGDVVQSGSDSTLGITFIDGTVFGLGPNAKMVLNEMVYDPNGSSNSALMSLVQGTISFVAGATAKHGDMKVDTPVATMGIRGTAVLVEIDFDVQGTGGVPPAKFQVLVEPDGTTGSYILFDKTTLNPIATVDRAGTQTVVNGQGSVSFVSSANLSADAQKLISDVFALKFTDNNNPNTKLTTNFTDSVIPITTTFKLASGDVVTQTLLLRILPDGSDRGGHAGGSLADHIPGPPAVATFNESFTERAGVTHSGLLDTVVNQIKWLDVNKGDTPSATVTFADFTYHDAASNDVTSSLTAAQIAAIKAVEAPLRLEHAPGNTNVGSATWTYSLADGAFDFLAAGETLVLTYTARVDNNFPLSNETTFKDFTITITGTDDTPVVTSAAQTAEITELPGTMHSVVPDTVSGTLTFTDADLTDTHTVTIIGVAASGVTSGLADQATVLNWLSLGALTDSTDGVTGSRDWTFAATDQNFDYLAAGETLTLTYTIQIDDQQGGVVTVPVTITVTGTNDKPVVTSAPQTGAITEIDGTTGSAQPDTASGVVTFADVDRSDTHSLTITGVTDQGATAGLADYATVLSWLSLGTLTDSTGGVTGSRAWTFSAADHNFDYLAVGETLTLTYTVQLADNHGGVTTEPITITINGSNDAPTLADVSAGSLTDTAAKDSFGSLTGLLQGHDVDDGETATLTYAAFDAGHHPVNTAVTGLYGSLTVNADGSYTYVPDAAAINALAAGNYADTFTVETMDAHGAVGTATLTIDVTGVNDAPITTDDIVSIPGNSGSAAGSLLANDSDAEHDVLSITGVGNDVATAGQFTVEGIYGELVVDPLTGTYTYTLGVTAAQAAAVAALPGGVNGVEQFTYQAFDGALGAYGHLTVKVEGVNDAPIFTGNDLAATYAPGSGAVALAGGVAAQDVDNVVFDGGSLTVAVTSGGHTGDTLTIVGNDHIFVDADNNVLFDVDGIGGEGAVLIGAMTGGLDSLTVDFNANADPAAVAALTQAIEFENANTAAEAGTRIVTFTLHDGSGVANDSGSFTASVDVDGNHPATITGDSLGVVYEDDHVVIPSGQTIANDVDSGTLSVQDVDPEQSYFLPVDQAALTGTYGDFTFDPDSGHWTYALVHDRVDQLAAGQIEHDTLTVTTADGTTQLITIEVNGTNDAPVVTAKDLPLDYVPNGNAVPLVDSVSVHDIDSSDFDGGSLTASVVDGRHDGDLLTITDDQYISVSGTTVMFDADGDGSGQSVAIGTLSDSVDPAIDLNGNATSDAVAHLIQAIRFQSIDANPVAGQRTVEFTLNDGDGIDHNGHDTGSMYATVNVDQAPLISTDNLHIFEEGQTVTISGLSVSDADAGLTEFFTFDAAAETSDSFVTPSSESGSLEDINGTLNSGLTYAPGTNPPLSDKIALTVTDGFGATDTVNLVFNVAGEGDVALQGTSGKDVIIATGYNDTLTGGAGADQFVFRAGTGSDTITDFTPGQDKIDLLDSMPFTPGDTESFNAWINDNAAVEQVGNDTLIHLDISDSIRLSNVSRGSLHANDFILHPGVIT